MTPYLRAQLRVGQRPPDRLGGGAHLGDGEAVLELHEVQQPLGEQVRRTAAGVALGVDDVLGADALQNAAVRGGDGLRPHAADAEVDEHGGR